MRTSPLDPSFPWKVVVVGAGRFGQRALAVLRDRYPRCDILVIDRKLQPLVSIRQEGGVGIQGDAVSLLDAILRQSTAPWIVPAVPLHLAFEWVRWRLSWTRDVRRIPVPTPLPLPNAMVGPSGDLYSSFATFRCPDDCLEPPGTCTVTGESRPLPLFQVMALLDVPGYRTLGLRSHQLGPGVGGYRGSSLGALYEALRPQRGNFLLYTACRCHGVLSALRLDSENPGT